MVVKSGTAQVRAKAPLTANVPIEDSRGRQEGLGCAVPKRGQVIEFGLSHHGKTKDRGVEHQMGKHRQGISDGSGGTVPITS